MKFGEVPVVEAEGTVLGHSVRHRGGVLKKGRVLGADDIQALRDGGVTRVYAGRLDADDVSEDDAAQRLGDLLAGQNVSVRPPATGRVNIHAGARGLAVIDAGAVGALNTVNESITVATVLPYKLVEDGEMVATVKIIPFAVAACDLDRALEVAEAAVSVAPLVLHRVGLIVTRVAGMRANLLKKAETAVRQRVEYLGSSVSHVQVVDHTVDAVAAAISSVGQDHDVVLVFGASAIVDRADVVPAALVAAGGEVEHLGMPVDPGNLLLLGHLDETPVVGVPSCARSPKLNGFDWVLARLLAGFAVTGRDVMNMGVGGLLKEIASRPSPRESGQ